MWCDGPYFPDWVAEHERNSIRARVGEFEASFRSVEGTSENSRKGGNRFASAVVESRRGRRGSVDRFAREGRFHTSRAHHGKRPLTLAWWAASGRNGHSFCYIPGAGDDESWANGSTSADFHAHREALLDIAESRFDTLVERIVSGRVTGVAKHRSEVEICGEGLLDADAMNEAIARWDS